MLTKAEHTRLKGRLTRAKGRSPEAVMAEVQYAFSVFHEQGFPDTWHVWEIAGQDALMEIRRKEWSL